MDNDGKLILRALERAGKSQDEGEEIKKELIRSRLDLTKENPDPEVLVSLDGLPLCTLGNFSVIVGLPGSRKSFLCTAIAGSYISPSGFMGMDNDNGPGRLLWFDSEQAAGHVARIGRRLHRIAGLPTDINSDSIIICMLREYSFDIRRKMVTMGIETYRPGFVVVDGLADLISNANDPEQSDSITDELMRLTTEYNCHILTVVHSNFAAADRARGHLGGDAIRKCETAISVTAMEETSVCTYIKTRDKRPNDYAFGISEGLPTEVPYKSRETAAEVLKKTFTAVMPTATDSATYSELCTRLMEVTGLKIDAAKKKIANATAKGIIGKTDDGVYHLNR